MPYHDSGGWSTAFQRGELISSPGQPMWDLWLAKWHWGQVFLIVLVIPPGPHIYPSTADAVG